MDGITHNFLSEATSHRNKIDFGGKYLIVFGADSVTK
jgi:hypothetical protein